MSTLAPLPHTLADLAADEYARLACKADLAIQRRVLPSYAAYPCLGLIFVLGFGYHRDHPRIAATFLLLVLVVMLARVAFHFLGHELHARSPRRWRIGFGVGVVVAVAVWVVFICYVLATRGFDRESLFLLLCSTGISAGATNTLSPNLWLIRAHLLTGVPPVIVACLLTSDPLRFPLAAIVTFQLVFHLVEARRLHDEHWQLLLGELVLQQRQSANQLLTTAIEHAAEAIAVVDADGIVYGANSAYELAGGPDLAAAALALATPAEATSAGVWRGDVHVCVPAGSSRHYEATLSPVGTAGAPSSRRVLVARDVTERDRADAERSQMREQLLLAERLASMGTLAAGVAHEINNPLAYVAGNLEHVARHLPFMASAADPALVDELSEAVADAREGAERVRRIVLDLKSFSRADAARGAVDVLAVLDLAVKMAAHEIRPRARLVKDYGTVPLVDGNQSQVGQVLLALLVNAAQAIPEGRPEENEIRVSARRLDSGVVAVEVQDTGAGIPPEIRGRIFEPFFTSKPIGVGTGLGLSICHGIVKSLGGEVTFESTVGHGSTFRVTLLPWSGPAPVAAPEPRVTRASKATILVVDDEPSIGAIVKRTLEPDYAVVVETGGRAALQRISRGEHYDALLCDVMMPDLSGLDLYEQLADVAPGLRQRVVFMTGGAFTPRAVAFLAEATHVHIAKPFDRSTLRAGLATVLDPRGRDRQLDRDAPLRQGVDPPPRDVASGGATLP